MAGPSGGATGVLNNYAATTPPTVANDASQGYDIGSTWFVAATGDVWRCRTAATGAASWVKIDSADHPGYVAGMWYIPFGQGAPVTGLTNAANLIYLGFGVIKQRITISQLGARVVTASSGGFFQLAIYNHNAATGKPTTLVRKTASASTTSNTNINAALDSNVTLEPGNYWFAHAVDNTTAVLLAQGATSSNHASMVGSATNCLSSPSAFVIGFFATVGTFGTWPADLSGFTLNELAGSPRPAAVQFLVASVP